MNFEFTPCVLRPNAESAPVYGLLIRPVTGGGTTTTTASPSSSSSTQQPVVVVQQNEPQRTHHHPQPILPALGTSNGKVLLPHSAPLPKSNNIFPSDGSQQQKGPYVVSAPFTGDYSQKSGFSSPVFVPASTVENYQQGDSHLSETQAVQVVPQLTSTAQNYHHAGAQPVYTHPPQHTPSYDSMDSGASVTQPCFLPSTGDHGHGTSSSARSQGSGEMTGLLDDIEPSFTRDLAAEFADIGRILAESESILSPDYLDGAVSEASGTVSSGQPYVSMSNVPSTSSVADEESQQQRANQYNSFHSSVAASNYSISSACPSSSALSQVTVPLSSASVTTPVRHACRFQDDQISQRGTQHSTSMENHVPRPQLEWERPQNEASGTPDSGIQSITGSPQGAGQSPISPLMRHTNSYHSNYSVQSRVTQPLEAPQSKNVDVQLLPATVSSKEVLSGKKSKKSAKAKMSTRSKTQIPPVEERSRGEFEDMPTLVPESIELAEVVDPVTDSAPDLANSQTEEDTAGLLHGKQSMIKSPPSNVMEEVDEKLTDTDVKDIPAVAKTDNVLVNKLLSSLRPDQLQLFTKLFDNKLQPAKSDTNSGVVVTKKAKKKSRRSVSRASDTGKKKKAAGESSVPEPEEAFTGYVSDTSSSISTPSEQRSASRASTSIAPPASSSEFCADVTKDPVLRDLSVSQQRSRSVASSTSTQKGPHTVSLREKRMLMRLQDFRNRGRNILDPALIEHVLDLASKLQQFSLSQEHQMQKGERNCFHRVDWNQLEERNKTKAAKSEEKEESPKTEAFDNLTNLEEEAESSDEEGKRHNTEDSPADDDPSPSVRKYVEIKESCDGGKISLKIRLGPVQLPPPTSLHAKEAEKKRKVCDSKTLPPKKRIKEQSLLEKSPELTPIVVENPCSSKEVGEELSPPALSPQAKRHKKRRKSKKYPWDRIRTKKHQTRETVTKSALIRKCKNCRTWLRVQTGPDSPEESSRLCFSCLELSPPNDTPAPLSQLKECKVVLRKDPVRRRGSRGLLTVQDQGENNHLPPKKKYPRAGSFDEKDRVMESSEALILTEEALGSTEKTSFRLPYDIWWDYCVFSKDPSSKYSRIKSNMYVDQPNKSSWDQQTLCNCSLPANSSGVGCEDNCLNRMMYAECDSGCRCGEGCGNQRIQKHQSSEKHLKKFNTGTERGYGVQTLSHVKKGSFLCEYVGEVVSSERFAERMKTIYAKSPHHYGLNLSSGYLIDSYRYGSIARFVNHSCDPCCEMQKWWVNGSYRVGLFALRDLEPGEELTYDYKFHSFRNLQRCMCGAKNCQGTIGSVVSAEKAVSGSTPNKRPDITKRVSQREKALVSERRLFLQRNIRRVRRRTVDSESGKATPSLQEGKRKELDVKEFILALRSSRTVRTRRFASVSENEGLIRVAELAQVLHNIFAALLASCPGGEKKLLEDLPQLSQMKNLILSGNFKSPQEFDEAITSAFQHLKKAPGKKRTAEAAREAYSKAKTESAEQLRDVLNYDLGSGFLTSPRNKGNESGKGDLITTSTDLSYMESHIPVGSYDADEQEGVWQKRADHRFPGLDLVRCVCGIVEEEGTMLQCDKCLYWQHADCLGGASQEGAYKCYFCTRETIRVPSMDIVQSQQPEIRLEGCTYYRCLRNKRGLQVRLSESVYVRRISDENHKEILKELEDSCAKKGNKKQKISKKTSDISPPTQDRRQDLRIFRVERLFTGPNNKRFVFGFYYARPHETFCEPTRKFYRNEVFCTPMYNTLPLDAVVARCLVLDSQTYFKGRPLLPSYHEADVFVCDFRVDKNQRFFERIGPKNRYPVSTEPYIFRLFPEKRKIKREFSPFIYPSEKKKPRSAEKMRGTAECSEEDVSLQQIKTMILSRKRHERIKNLDTVISGIYTVQQKRKLNTR